MSNRIAALLIDYDERLAKLVREYLRQKDVDVAVARGGEPGIGFGARQVSAESTRAVLTHLEFELLTCLARAAGRVLSREHLMEALKGQEFDSFDRSIDVHVSKLRGKIEIDPRSPQYIK